MSGLGVAISGLVNGFTAGRDVKHRWEDRKDDKIRQKRLDELKEAAEVRAQQTHDQNMITGGLLNDARRQALRTGEQSWQDFQSTRSAADAALTAAEAGVVPMGAAPETPPMAFNAEPITKPWPLTTSGVSTKSPGDAPARLAFPDQPQASVVRAPDAPTLTFGATPAAPVRANDAPAPALNAAVGDGPLFTDAGGGKVMTARPPRTPEETRQIAQAAKEKRLIVSSDRIADQQRIDRQHVAPAQTYSIEDWQGMSRPERERAGLPVSDIGGQMYFDRFSVGMGAEPPRKAGQTEQAAAEAWTDARRAVTPNPDATPLQRDVSALGRSVIDTGRAAGETAATWTEQALNAGSDALDVLNAPFRAASEYVLGEDVIGSAPRADLNADGRNTSVFSPYFDLMRPAPQSPDAAKAALDAETAKPAPKNGKPPSAGETAVAAGATRAMDAVGDTPDMQAAAAAVPPQSLGATPGRPMTEAQTTKGAKTLMESWRVNGAPIMQRELLRQGRVEEAQQLETWVKSADAQKGMELWAKGQFQAQMGDLMGAFDTWTDAFNESGYYDDGYEIVKDKSKVLRDRAGNPIGVDVTFRNQATGETHSREMTAENMGEAFGLILSPVEAFKASQERQAKLSAALLEAERSRAKTAQDLIVKDHEITSKAINDAALKLMEAAQFSGSPMTYEEALAAARAAHSGEGQGSGVPDADVPVAHRPQG